MRVAVACLLVLALTGCSLGGGDDDTTEGGPDDTATDSGCLVDPARVGELLGYDVRVEAASKRQHECRFRPDDEAAHPGAEVLVVERELADGGDDAFEAARGLVEREAGPTTALEDGDVDHADRGWVARVGRAVQVGAARERRLVQVTVVDGALEPAAAEDIALELAGRALG